MCVCVLCGLAYVTVAFPVDTLDMFTAIAYL